MAARSRSKGKRGEREVVAMARAAGLPAERTWHLAQSPDAEERCCDVTIAGRPVQVRLRGKGFAVLYGALEGVEVAFLRSNRREWLAVLPAEAYLRLLVDKRSEMRN